MAGAKRGKLFTSKSRGFAPADRNATQQFVCVLSWACFIVLTYTPVRQCPVLQFQRPLWNYSLFVALALLSSLFWNLINAVFNTVLF